MNSFKGRISNIETENLLSMVEVDVNGCVFKSIILEKQDSSSYLKIGNEITVMFKETEVILATESIEKISLQNRIEGKVVKINKGKLLSEIVLESKIGKIKSIITTKSANRLEIEVGKNIYAMIKTSEVMLSR